MSSRLAYRATALGPLGKIDWTIPPGVSAVVGPNRVGKSTLLRLPEFVKIAFIESLGEAARVVFEGTAHLRNFAASPTQPTSVGASHDDCDWDTELMIAGASVASLCAEKLRVDQELALWRDFGATRVEAPDGKQIALGAHNIPRALFELVRPVFPPDSNLTPDQMREAFSPVLARHSPELSLDVAVSALKLASRVGNALGYRTYHYQLSHLLKYGSAHSPDRSLQVSGENVFPLLRNWRDSSEHEARFDFVIATLREAFPHVRRVDFEQAGQTVTMAIRDARWSDKRVPIARESTGLITALLQLCAVASGMSGSLVTIDELETSLHPHAIRTLISAFRRWAQEKDLRIVLATQSETVLDQFRDEPSQIFVIEPKQETSPRALTELFSPEWLSQFSLGDLFSHLEFGSNGEVPPA